MASKGIEYWTSQWRDDHGRRRKKTFGRVDRVTEAAASRVYAEWLVDWFSQADVQTPISVITMTEFFTRYTSHAQVYYRRKDKTPTSEVDRIWHACNRMSLLFGRMPASDVQPQHLLGFRQSLIDGGLMRTTVNAYVSIIKRAYKWGKNQGMVAGKAYDAIRDIGELTAGRSEAEDPEKIVGVPWAIVEATLHHMPDVVRTMVMLQWHTGMRPGEVCGIKGIEIDTAESPWLYKPKHHKLAHRKIERRIYFGPESQKLLEPYLTRHLTDHLFSPAEAHRQRLDMQIANYSPADGSPDYRQWPSYQRRREQARGNGRHGARYTTGSYRNAVHAACDDAFDPLGEAVASGDTSHRWNPNQLRHAAKDRFERQYDLRVAGDLLGHVSTSTTGKYGEKNWDKAREAAAAAS